jgi:hypothetical protein
MNFCYHFRMPILSNIRCLWVLLGLSSCFFACQVSTSSAAEQNSQFGEARLSVAGAHRYKISVVISSKGALLVASKRHTAALYRTDQIRISAGRFYARFGHLGVVSVRFRPHRQERSLSKRSTCNASGARTGSRGIFVGRIRFQGEKNYTSVERSRAHGTVSRGRNGRRECGRITKSAPTIRTERRRGFGLRVFSGGRDLVTFSAGRNSLAEFQGWESRVGIPLGLQNLSDRGVPFTALSVEQGKGVEIIRLAAGAGDKESFVVGDEGRVAGVRPPAPFVGAAEFKMCTLKRWTGTLKVMFPGRVQPLVGRKFTALLRPSASDCT